MKYLMPFLLLASCAHDPVLEKKINAEAEQQPAFSSRDRLIEARKAIEEASLSEEQKARLLELSSQVAADREQIRAEESKYRLLLVKQLVDPHSSDREIVAIKRKILELNHKESSQWLSALDEARRLIGRSNAQDTRLYRAFLEDPLPSREK
jgi:hypothetical protein